MGRVLWIQGKKTPDAAVSTAEQRGEWDGELKQADELLG
jgi:hypothetical protein